MHMGAEPEAWLAQLTALQALEAMNEGRVSAEEYTAACLARIAEAEERVGAWAFLDREHALAQARALDEHRGRGFSLGPLHGLPVGIKDIIDVDGLPTEYGTALHAGRRATRDATLVARLKQAGAVIIGKTVTTEMATYAPGKTRNPHNPEHTPGGSSSGSAAAVAAGMVPLAVGTQTNGSVIRPAAYCGVYGYKPSFGMISRTGVLAQSRPLDQVGVFARTVEDAALIAEQMTGFDESDPDTQLIPRPRLLEVARQEPPMPPLFAFVKTPAWEQADAETHAAFAEIAEALGGQVEEVALPESFREAWDWHRTIMEADLARSFHHEYERGRDQLSESLRGQIERGRTVLACDYNNAVDRVRALNAGLDELYFRYSAILTPAATGAAPAGLASTGSPVFCTLWTLCGMPAASLPVLQAENGLPMAVQLVGYRGDDARLLRNARWLVNRLGDLSPS